MHSACCHADCMQRNIQIRHVPERVHRTLKARAAQAGMTLSGYLLREIKAVAERRTLEEIFERVRARGPVHVSIDPVAAVRAERDARS